MENEVRVHACHEKCDNTICLMVRELEELRAEVAVCRERLGPAGYRILKDVVKYREALEYIAWPGPERDHWDRVNKAKEALQSANE